MGTEMEDSSLLRRYAASGDQEAFRQLIRLHGPWVYSAARRQLGDGHLAEDVTQAVFILLARKAGRLGGYAYLGGWLFATLRYAVRAARRQRMRQERREREAARMRSQTIEAEDDREEIEAVLDEAVGALGKADRDAVLLRFYEQKPLAEVGAALGVSQDAARKRVERAVARLRAVMSDRGATISASGLALIAPGSIAPTLTGQLVETIAKGAAGAKGQMAGTLADIAWKMMWRAKLRLAAAAAGAGVGVMLIVAVGAAELLPPAARREPATAATTMPARNAPAALGPKDTMVAFQADILALRRDGIRQAFAAEGELEKRLADLTADYAVAAQTLQNEVAGRFPGNPRTRGLPHINPIPVERMTETIDGDSASVSATGGRSINMKRVDGRWCIPIREFGSDPSLSLERRIAEAERSMQSVQAALAVASAGRGATLDEIMAAFTESERRQPGAVTSRPATAR